MVSIKSGLLGGVVATFAISAIVQMKKATGSLPDVHLLNAWSALVGEPTHLAAGWITHLVVSIIVGGIGFALLSSKLPSRSFAIKGAAFGVLMWLMIMLVVMPLAGAGVFASHQSAMAPAAILVLYLIYGLILGQFYRSDVSNARLQKTSRSG